MPSGWRGGQEAAYDLSIDYSQPPPPPPMSETDLLWMQTLLSKP